ncbi:MAG: VWA domain-containing protein [Butyrivibrio sp.]|uniref:vWA domain-containing protein n=1 Tax=Butyrivibrio sp. TaxID=28121 RepID=UPI001ED37322|nr:vWA domain-containing protein [Butyrivibrio sp.]MBE5840734.1 VWA domain-containing protein [Butyrivibrio sp.]
MRLLPILPIFSLLAIFIILMTATVIIIWRNQLKLKEKIFAIARLSIIYILVLCIGLRPVTVDDNVEFATKNLDVLFVVDTTLSMWAEDYSGKNTRMSGALKDVQYIIDELAGSNFAIVTFDNKSKVVSPFTQDVRYIEDLMATITQIESYDAAGSSLNLPYYDMRSLLSSSRKKENRRTVVFYISDGEITNGEELQSYAELAEFVDTGAVLGYGSEKGGKMKDGSWGYVYDSSTHKDAVSVIDEANLQQVATDLNISYFNMNSGHGPIKGIIEEVKNQCKTVMDKETGAERYIDMYYYFAIPLALMMLLELYIIIRKGRL